RALKNKVVVALILVASLSLGCKGKDAAAPGVDPKVVAAWNYNEKIFEKALNENQEGDEFDRACEFFWRLTGIELHVNYSTVGILPTEETPKDLVRIKNWYKVNKERLYWDESTGAVKVHPIQK